MNDRDDGKAYGLSFSAEERIYAFNDESRSQEINQQGRMIPQRLVWNLAVIVDDDDSVRPPPITPWFGFGASTQSNIKQYGLILWSVTYRILQKPVPPRIWYPPLKYWVFRHNLLHVEITV